MNLTLILLPLLSLQLHLPPQVDPPTRAQTVVLDDFQDASPGKLPKGWFHLRDRDLKPMIPDYQDAKQRFFVVQEGTNKFVRVYTEGEAHHMMLRVDEQGYGWNLKENPYLSWRWRARKLPAGAREDKVNDAGAAVYVTFDRTDWLGRPHSIKYTYSSTLPVGTVVDTGPVRVLVVASGRDGLDRWKQEFRDVAADYRQLFGEAPPNKPVTVMIWSDSDNTGGVAEADFDDLLIRSSLPGRSRN